MTSSLACHTTTQTQTQTHADKNACLVLVTAQAHTTHHILNPHTNLPSTHIPAAFTHTHTHTERERETRPTDPGPTRQGAPQTTIESEVQQRKKGAFLSASASAFALALLWLSHSQTMAHRLGLYVVRLVGMSV